jgi:hypothetical protein
MIINLKKLGPGGCALKINRVLLISLQAMEEDFPAALNEFFAHVAVLFTTLGAQDIQTQEPLRISKSTHSLLENREVPIQRLAELMHLDGRTLFKRYEQAGYPLQIR